MSSAEGVATVLTATEGRQLLESDAAYFDLAAQLEPLEGATLAYMPEFAPLDAACVVQRVQPSKIRKPVAWVATVEREIKMRGFRTARVYLTQRGPALEAALAAAGFRPRIEYGFFFTREVPQAKECGTLREVLSAADWRTKAKLHCESKLGSDGYRSDGELWTHFVRAKCESGGKRSYLIEENGETCGSIGTMEFDAVIRLKNLFVSPRKLRRGLGSSAVRTLAQLNAAKGKPAGIFAVKGGAGEATYRSLGMDVVTQHTEWSKQL